MSTTALWLALGLLAPGPVPTESPREAPGSQVELPKANDGRLSVTLFAAERDIVTPTGIAVDRKGRVYCIESHTHFRPENYDGPIADRIRVFEDSDGDGRADRIRTFFGGTKWTMALAIDRDDSVVVATRYEVFRLRDQDGDGEADQKTTLVHLDTPGAYPHNGLSGVTFDFAGNIWFGLGENLGDPYTLVGSDGSKFSGGGEGGSIYRCKNDGSKLERVATGFWNPFGLAFDPFGRLFSIDNDPDSRPPCRFLHIVEGGDYGYRYRNGRKGLHPFTAWNGELPGTLPMICGTGEAPSGVLIYESDNLPEDYRGTALVTSWGDHRLERYRLNPRGTSFGSTLEPVLTGGENFRPVGIAVAPDGSIYLSDWVDKSYDLHGKGRIWHVQARDEPRRTSPDEGDLAHADRSIRTATARTLVASQASRDQLAKRAPTFKDPRARAIALEALAASGGNVSWAAKDPSADIRSLLARVAPEASVDLAHAKDDPSAEVYAEILRHHPIDRENTPSDETLLDAIGPALASGDPFLRQAARQWLKREGDIARLTRLTKADEPAHRLAAALVLRDFDTPENREVVAKLLVDPDPDVRFVAIQWVGESKLGKYRPALVEGLASRAETKQLFEGYLAAIERLDGGLREQSQEIGGQDYVAALLLDPKTKPAVAAQALRVLRPDHPALSLERVNGLLASDDPALQLEAVRTLRESPHEGRIPLLLEIARDTDRPERLRAEAIVGLSGDDPDQKKALVDLAVAGPPSIRHEALRSLRGATLGEAQRVALRQESENDPVARELIASLDQADRFPDAPPEQDLDAWLARLDGPGDPEAGQRIFFHPKGPGCARCHEVDGRGGRIGPELTVTSRALDRHRLVESIVQPSKEVAPMFVPWLIAKTDGTIVTGLLLSELLDGGQIYADRDGKTFTLKPAEIAERRPEATSLMPDDLAHSLTPGEFRDLLAFLQGEGAQHSSE